MTNTQKKTYMGLDPLICYPNTLLHIVLQQFLYLGFFKGKVTILVFFVSDWLHFERLPTGDFSYVSIPGRAQLGDHDITVLSAVPAPVAAQVSPPSEALGGHDLEDSWEDMTKHSMYVVFAWFAYLYIKKIDQITVYYCNLNQESAGEPKEMQVTLFAGGGEAVVTYTYTPQGIVWYCQVIGISFDSLEIFRVEQELEFCGGR